MAVPEADAVISARDLHMTYRRGAERVEALRGVDLDVPRGAFVSIVGPSGSGKSTLLHLLGGVDRPTQGSIRVEGVALERASEAERDAFRRQYVGFVFQFDNLFSALDALDNAALPLLARGLGWGEARARAGRVLEQVGLGDRLRHRPAQLSGGQQQRVAIARAIVGEPALVLADEPTGDLDASTAHEVVALMAALNRRLGITFVVATHNPGLLAEHGPLYALEDGRLGPWQGDGRW